MESHKYSFIMIMLDSKTNRIFCTPWIEARSVEAAIEEAANGDSACDCKRAALAGALTRGCERLNQTMVLSKLVIKDKETGEIVLYSPVDGITKATRFSLRLMFSCCYNVPKYGSSIYNAIMAVPDE